MFEEFVVSFSTLEFLISGKNNNQYTTATEQCFIAVTQSYTLLIFNRNVHSAHTIMVCGQKIHTTDSRPFFICVTSVFIGLLVYYEIVSPASNPKFKKVQLFAPRLSPHVLTVSDI